MKISNYFNWIGEAPCTTWVAATIQFCINDLITHLESPKPACFWTFWNWRLMAISPFHHHQFISNSQWLLRWVFQTNPFFFYFVEKASSLLLSQYFLLFFYVYYTDRCQDGISYGMVIKWLLLWKRDVIFWYQI